MFAAKLGFSETVFVDDPERGVVGIHVPVLRLPFAGYSCVSAAWLNAVPRLHVLCAGEAMVSGTGLPLL